MSGRVNAFDEGLAQVRDDATLRALAELDSLEPSVGKFSAPLR